MISTEVFEAMPLSDEDLRHIASIVRAAIAEQIGHINEQLVAGDAKFAALEERQQKHQDILDGAGERPGLKMQVHDLVEAEATRAKLLWLAIAAVMTPVVGGT